MLTDDHELIGRITMSNTCKEVSIRMPTVYDLIEADIDIGRITESMEEMIKLISLCCMVDIDTVKSWPLNEYYKIINIVADGILKL